MEHLIFVFYILALFAGAAALGQTILLYLRFRKPVIKYYGLFLLSLLFFLFMFITDLYGTIAGVTSVILDSLLWLFQAVGGILFVLCAPYFYATLLGIVLSQRKKIVFFILDALLLVAVFTYVVVPSLSFTVIILNLLLFGMIGYGLLLILIHLKRIVDATLRKTLILFFVLTAVFLPLFFLDILTSRASVFSGFRFIEGLALPAYLLVLNVLTIVFAVSYLNRPPYIEKNRLTEYFISTFHITPREEEILSLLLEGRSNKEIGELLFISPKTVENHTYNIYQKVGINTRVQLFQLIQANSAV